MEMDLEDTFTQVNKITKKYNIDHLPLGVSNNGLPDRRKLNYWWMSRSIPASRDGIDECVTQLGVESSKQLLGKSLGLSLSDHYWICPADHELRWEDINFFDNDFSEDVGNVLLGMPAAGKINLMSPDNTSDGWLRKRWKIIDGKRCLIKGGSLPFCQEPYNEVIAGRIMERLQVEHVNYDLFFKNTQPYSVCESFTNADSELISAANIMDSVKKRNNISYYGHYVYCCKEIGINNIVSALDKMLTVDYIIANEDRHLNNFGVLRNPDTLEYIGAAPIYDSGTSLWYNRLLNGSFTPSSNSKPFKNTHEEQIKLVSSFDWLEFDKLKNIDEEFNDILKGSPFIDENRRSTLSNALTDRIKMLHQIALSKVKQFAINIPEKEKSEISTHKKPYTEVTQYQERNEHETER